MPKEGPVTRHDATPMTPCFGINYSMSPPDHAHQLMIFDHQRDEPDAPRLFQRLLRSARRWPLPMAPPRPPQTSRRLLHDAAPPSLSRLPRAPPPAVPSHHYAVYWPHHAPWHDYPLLPRRCCYCSVATSSSSSGSTSSSSAPLDELATSSSSSGSTSSSSAPPACSASSSPG